MADSINDFTNSLNESARSSLFRATISFPQTASSAAASKAVPTLLFSGSIPASTVDEIEVKFRGRSIYEPGARTYAPWEAQVYNDVGYTIRKALEEWSEMIRNTETHGGIGNPYQFKSDVQIAQLDRNGNETRKYILHGAWPQDIQNIELDYNNEEIERYSVTFRYDYFTVV